MGLKIQPRLQLESSIIQVNTAEEQRKKVEKETEGQEKNKLKEEIDRLKKIIRDLQIEKIKSIDHDNELADSALLKSPLTSRVVNPEPKQIEKESNSSHHHAIQHSQWGSSTRKARLVE